MTRLPATKETLLLVDSDAASARTLAQALEHQGYTVHHAHSAEEALPLISALRPDFGVFDHKLPGASGMVLVELLHRIQPQAHIVVLTRQGASIPALDANRLGTVQLLPKTSLADEILAALCENAPAEPETTPPDETEILHRKLDEHQGNITATARALKMHRRTLQRKLARGTEHH